MIEAKEQIVQFVINLPDETAKLLWDFIYNVTFQKTFENVKQQSFVNKNDSRVQIDLDNSDMNLYFEDRDIPLEKTQQALKNMYNLREEILKYLPEDFDADHELEKARFERYGSFT